MNWELVRRGCVVGWASGRCGGLGIVATVVLVVVVVGLAGQAALVVLAVIGAPGGGVEVAVHQKYCGTEMWHSLQSLPLFHPHHPLQHTQLPLGPEL